MREDEREMETYFLPKLEILRFDILSWSFEISHLSILLQDDGHVPLSWDCKKWRAAQDHLSKLPVPIWKAASLPFVCIHLSEMKVAFPAALERLVSFQREQSLVLNFLSVF